MTSLIVLISHRMCTIIGLLMITVGTGGIKPCVTSFGGDQFKLPQQEKQLAMYFSVLYFIICTGSLIAKTVSPILRSDVHCFGDKDCYSLAFGAPALVVVSSIGKLFLLLQHMGVPSSFLGWGKSMKHEATA